jgi:vanillate O-demethylase ferredoxin subunit
MTALAVQVAAVRTEAEGVKAFTLESLTGEPLPAFAPGAHIEVRGRISGGEEEAWRAYSLTSDPSETHAYEIGVLRVGNRGVSAWLHDYVRVGDVLTIAPPRNDFPLANDAAEHVLLAGGIGITPLLAMVHWLERRGARYRLVVSARAPRRLAFRDALSRLGIGQVRLHFTGAEGRLNLAAEIGAPATGRHLYVCGPNAMVQEARRVARELGWLDSTVHVELFNATAAAGDAEFEVELARSGAKFTVPPGRTILELMLERGVFPSYDCQRGECGACLTRVLAGEPLHRDVYQTDEEKAANEFMTVCVSRAKTPRLALDA